MAVRNLLVRADPVAVWSVLADPRSYSGWVLGTSDVVEVRGHWPAEGSSFQYLAKLGGLRISDTTFVRVSEPPSRLELEARLGRFGVLRVSFVILRWGAASVVAVDEHPLGGPLLVLDSLFLDTAFTWRNKHLLRRLARVAEGRAAP
ncbi:MAG: SRPBCC family protein [Acidimicrobiaceae bacterium]|nr:SRPBCC family protein [Acidimicrobiaceae bacterium]